MKSYRILSVYIADASILHNASCVARQSLSTANRYQLSRSLDLLHQSQHAESHNFSGCWCILVPGMQIDIERHLGASCQMWKHACVSCCVFGVVACYIVRRARAQVLERRCTSLQWQKKSRLMPRNKVVRGFKPVNVFIRFLYTC